MRVLCILTDGYEELEAVGTIALLRRAGIDLDTIDPNAYDVLFFPGGPHYQKLEANDNVMAILKAFMDADKVVAAICAAPTILGRQGYLKGKNYTCFTSMNEDFGGTYVDQYTVTDGNLITGRSAAAVIDFAFAIIEKLAGKEKAEAVKNEIYYY